MYQTLQVDPDTIKIGPDKITGIFLNLNSLKNIQMERFMVNRMGYHWDGHISMHWYI